MYKEYLMEENQQRNKIKDTMDVIIGMSKDFLLEYFNWWKL